MKEEAQEICFMYNKWYNGSFYLMEYHPEDKAKISAFLEIWSHFVGLFLLKCNFLRVATKFHQKTSSKDLKSIKGISSNTFLLHRPFFISQGFCSVHVFKGLGPFFTLKITRFGKFPKNEPQENA